MLIDLALQLGLRVVQIPLIALPAYARAELRTLLIGVAYPAVAIGRTDAGGAG